MLSLLVTFLAYWFRSYRLNPLGTTLLEEQILLQNAVSNLTSNFFIVLILKVAKVKFGTKSIGVMKLGRNIDHRKDVSSLEETKLKRKETGSKYVQRQEICSYIKGCQGWYMHYCMSCSYYVQGNLFVNFIIYL